MKIDPQYFLVEQVQAEKKKRLGWTYFEPDNKYQETNYYVALITLMIHLTIFAFGYNWWANYSYWMVLNSCQIAVMHLMISKLSDETYNEFIIERYWWLMWLLGVWNALCFGAGLIFGLVVYFVSTGIASFFAISIVTFELSSRGPLLVAVITSAVCQESRNFYKWEKYNK